MENIKKFFHDPQKLYFLSVLNACLALFSYYFLLTNKSLTEIYLIFAKHSYKVNETNINLIIFFSFFLCANLVSFVCSCIYFQKSIRNINKRYSQVTTKIQEAEEELTKKDDEIADLQERLEAEEKWSNTLEKERDQHDFSHLEQTRALEKELAELEEENQGLRDEIERLQKELAWKSEAEGQGVDAAQAESLEAFAKESGGQAANIDRLALPKYGAIKFVDDCYRANMTPEQTAVELSKLGYKNPSICALLHPDDIGKGPDGQVKKLIDYPDQYGRDLIAGRVKGKKAW